MKIFVCDYAHRKSTRHWIKWLEKNHTVIVNKYFNPIYAQWADMIWIEWCEGPAQEASLLSKEYVDVCDEDGLIGEHHERYSGKYDWSGKPIYIRPIDIDVHYGHFRGVKWENVTGLFYIAPHFLEMIKKDITLPEKLLTAETPVAIDQSEWTFRKRDGSGRNIAWMNHSWSAKGLPFAIHGLEKLIRVTGDKTWKLHIVENGRSDEHWMWRYLNHIIKDFGLEDNVVWSNGVESVDEFLNDKDYLWQTSYKEGFSLIMGEALSKGIRSLTSNWESSKHIWGEELVWNTIDELVEKTIAPNYDSERYRQIASKYSAENEVEMLRKLTGL